ncbi:tubulin/FtsZ family protein [Halorubrum yunnanense]|uniref:Tubulin-like protein CetZ n=1 Tax=Halorubrum yunnanense TaxID=1526162 RepID=A0ABD5YIN0_9EURY|nr:tubulin/FtsZ family protein [Halorubrum yunnanense]
MKLALIGVGGAGTRIVDRFVRAERDTGRSVTNGNVLAFTTDPRAFDRTTALSADRQVVLGDAHPDVTRRGAGEGNAAAGERSRHSRAEPTEAGEGSATETAPEGAPVTDGDSDGLTDAITNYGVGGDPELGARVAQADRPEIRRALDPIEETDVAATMLVAGLGGGTGCGVGSVLLEELQSIYETSVYALGVLPATAEPDRRTLTAARGVRTFVPLADSMFLVDNEAWCSDADRVVDRYEPINAMTVERLLSVFGAGERDCGSVSEMRVDSADIQRTLDVGGVATIGRETVRVEPESRGLIARILRLIGRSPETDSTAVDASMVKHLISRALQSKLTLPCDITSADRVFVILTGPPDTISRKGFETGRYLLEEETETVEVLAGDEPIPGAPELTATVVLSNVTTVPRIERLQRRAVAIQTDGDPNDKATSATDTERPAATKSTDERFDRSNPDDDAASHGFDFGDTGRDLGE